MIYLTDVNFDVEDGDSFIPHIAYTLDGGAASGRNDALLFKGEKLETPTTELLEVIKSLGLEIPSEGITSPDVNKLVVDNDKSPLNENVNKSSQGENMSGDINVQELINKALADQEAVYKAKFEAQDVLVKAMEAKFEAQEIAEFKKQAVEAGVAVDAQDKIAKSWFDMSKVDAEAVQSIIKAMKDTYTLVTKSDLFVQKGSSQKTDAEQSAEDALAAAIAANLGLKGE